MVVIQTFFSPPQAAMNVDHEVNLLVEEIHRLGSKSKYYNTGTVFLLSLLKKQVARTFSVTAYKGVTRASGHSYGGSAFSPRW